MSKQDSRASCLVLLIMLGAFPFIILLKSYVIVDIWAMFVTPTWNIATPSMPSAYALALLFALLVPRQVRFDEEKKEERNPVGYALMTQLFYLFYILIIWGVAAVIHAFWGHG